MSPGWVCLSIPAVLSHWLEQPRGAWPPPQLSEGRQSVVAEAQSQSHSLRQRVRVTCSWPPCDRIGNAYIKLKSFR